MRATVVEGHYVVRAVVVRAVVDQCLCKQWMYVSNECQQGAEGSSKGAPLPALYLASKCGQQSRAEKIFSGRLEPDVSALKRVNRTSVQACVCVMHDAGLPRHEHAHK